MFSSRINTCRKIAEEFAEDIAILYGVNGDRQRIVAIFNWGWKPLHATCYCRKSLFDQFGVYKLDYRNAGDYELMLWFIHSNNIHAYHLHKVPIKVGVGGMSNKSLNNRVQAMRFDLNAMRNNKIFLPM